MISINNIFKTLQSDYYSWFNSKKISSLYLLGSITTKEYNSSLDIDLLGITEDFNENNNSILYRYELQKLNSNNVFYNTKIGLRIRHVSELEDFNRHMLYWGYNNEKYAQLLLGKSYDLSLRHFSPNLETLLNNINVELWYDNKKITKITSKEKVLYYDCKSILNTLHIFLLSKNIQLYTHKERVNFVIDKKLIEENILNKLDLERCLNVKLGKEIISNNDMGIKRHNFLVFTFNQILRSNLSVDKNLKDKYWGIEKVKQKAFEMIGILNYNELINKTKYIINFPYIFIFFIFLVSLDKVRLGINNKVDNKKLELMQDFFFKPILEKDYTIKVEKASDIPVFIDAFENYRFKHDIQFKNDIKTYNNE